MLTGELFFNDVTPDRLLRRGDGRDSAPRQFRRRTPRRGIVGHHQRIPAVCGYAKRPALWGRGINVAVGRLAKMEIRSQRTEQRGSGHPNGSKPANS